MIRARAALLLLAAALPLGGCPGGAPEPQPDPAVSPPDPAVVAALAKRPDLAKGKVWVLGLDGCDPGLVRDLAAAGRLPNFQRLMKEGAFGALRSQEPMLSPLLWTTIATGKYPTEHGVLDFMVRSRSDPKAQETVTSRHRQVEALWDIAGRHGRTVGVVGWLASHPAERVNGFAVSERIELLAYLYNEGVAASDEGKSWPAGLLAEIAPHRKPASAVTLEEASRFIHVTPDLWQAATKEEKFTDDNRTNNLRLILAASENFRRIDLHLWKTKRPALFCTYFEMIDAVSHYFMAYRDPITWKPQDLESVQQYFVREKPELVAEAWRWARGEGPRPEGIEPERLATIREVTLGAEPDKVERFKDAVDAAYEWTDRLLGEAMAACDADTTLLVVSDHGFANGHARGGKPPFDSSFRSRLGGANFHLPHGMLGAWGRGVKKGTDVPPHPGGKSPTGVRLIDVAPTVLALMGFPKADDMPGRVATEIFDLDLATGKVPTYESGRTARLAKERAAEETRRPIAGGSGREAAEDRALDDAMKNLSAVGYVGTAEEGPVRAMTHMGSSYLEQERYAEAEEAFAEAAKTAKGKVRIQCLVQVGNARYHRGDAPGAKKAYEGALAEEDKSEGALNGLARLAQDAGDFPALVGALDQLADIRRKDPDLKLRLADALRLRSEGQAEAGVPDLRRAADLVREAFTPPPDAKEGEFEISAMGHNLGGMVLLRAMEFKEAAEHFLKAVELAPDYVRPRTNLGVLHLNLAGNAPDAAARAAHRAEALRWFGEVLERQPRNPKALYNRAEAHYHLEPRDLEAAEKDLRAALAADPKYKRASALLDKVTKERQGPR
jgi:tetratricopeptide (TPR) repeat protein